MVIESCIACHKTVSDHMVLVFVVSCFGFARLAGPWVSAVSPVSNACPAIGVLGFQPRASASEFFTCVLGMDLGSSGLCWAMSLAPRFLFVLRRRSCDAVQADLSWLHRPKQFQVSASTARICYSLMGLPLYTQATSDWNSGMWL